MQQVNELAKRTNDTAVRQRTNTTERGVALRLRLTVCDLETAGASPREETTAEHRNGDRLVCVAPLSARTCPA